MNTEPRQMDALRSNCSLVALLVLLLGAAQAEAVSTNIASRGILLAQSSPPANVRQEKVVFSLPVKIPDEGQVWAYVSRGAGYFKDENLDVHMVPNSGGGASLLQVASGSGDFCVGNPEEVINAVAEGLDIKAVATVFTSQIYRFIVSNESPIRSYSDLRGKKVGVSSFTSGSFPFAKFALGENGVDPLKEVEFVQTGAGGPALRALQTREVAALSIWDTQIARFKSLGAKIRELPRTTNVAFPGNLICVRSELLNSKPDVVARFSRAFIKGIVFAHANPEAAIKMFREQYPDAARGRSFEDSVQILKARLENLQLKDSQKGWGWIPIGEYEKLQEEALRLGTIKRAVNLREVMTNRLAPEIQRFNAAALGR